MELAHVEPAAPDPGGDGRPRHAAAPRRHDGTEPARRSHLGIARSAPSRVGRVRGQRIVLPRQRRERGDAASVGGDPSRTLRPEGGDQGWDHHSLSGWRQIGPAENRKKPTEWASSRTVRGPFARRRANHVGRSYTGTRMARGQRPLRQWHGAYERRPGSVKQMARAQRNRSLGVHGRPRSARPAWARMHRAATSRLGNVGT